MQAVLRYRRAGSCKPRKLKTLLHLSTARLFMVSENNTSSPAQSGDLPMIENFAPKEVRTVSIVSNVCP